MADQKSVYERMNPRVLSKVHNLLSFLALEQIFLDLKRLYLIFNKPCVQSQPVVTKEPDRKYIDSYLVVLLLLVNRIQNNVFIEFFAKIVIL